MNFEDANTKLNNINGKVRNIIGFYREDVVLQANQILFQQIDTCITDLLANFGLLNMDASGEAIFKVVRPFLSSLVGYLNEFQGVLENELIINN